VTPDQVFQELTVIEAQVGRLLDDGGRSAIQQARRDVQRLVEARRGSRKRKGRGEPWTYQIPPGAPLSFVPTTISAAVKHQLIVDLFCQIAEPDDGLPLDTHSIVIRVWTEDRSLWLRPGLDDPQLGEPIAAAGGRRVIHRVHLDFANLGQPGPRFHMQLGGGQHGQEFCWFPDNLKLPRFVHQPASLITACEFVLRTFFPSEYETVAREATWIGAIRVAQDAYLVPYFKHLLRLQQLDVTESLLARAWNPPA
jgi:hypothetical protein